MRPIACGHLHYFGLYLVAFQVAALFLLAPRSFISVAAVYLPVAAAYSPRLPAMLGQFRDRPTAATPVAGSLFILSLIASWRSFASAVKEKSLGQILPGILLVPYAVEYVISENHSPIPPARSMIIALPATCFLLGRSSHGFFRANPQSRPPRNHGQRNPHK